MMWARLLRADGRAFAIALECKPWMLGGRIAATDGGLASVGLLVPPVVRIADVKASRGRERIEVRERPRRTEGGIDGRSRT